MKLLTKEQKEWYKNAKICHICKKNFKINKWKIRNIVKLEIIVIIQGNKEVLHCICNLKYSVLIKNSYSFHNGSNYDYSFIIKELPDESEKQFTCLGENTEKIHNFYSSNRKIS